VSACQAIRDALAKGEALSDSQARHAEGCETCSDLLGADAELARGVVGVPAPAAEDLGPLLAAVERRIDQERGPVAWLRSRPTPLRHVLGALLPLAIVAWILIAKRRPDLAVYPAPRLLLTVLVYAGLLGAVVRSTLAPLQERALAARTRWLLVAAALLVPFLVAALPQAHAAHAASLAGAGDDFARRALACFGFGEALALAVLVAWAALARDAHHGVKTAALAAVGAGLAGILALELHCPITHPLHLLVGHATVGLALALVYPLVRRLVGKAAS